MTSGHGEIDNKRSIETSDIPKTLFPTLPEHLILDHILPRLPVNSLTRFKLVSKFWLSTISSVDFAQTHLKFSSLYSQFVALSIDYSLGEHYKLFLLPYDESNCNVRDLVRLDLDDSWDFTKLDVVGSYNGLVCLYVEEEADCYFCVWNPATKQCREIRNPATRQCREIRNPIYEFPPSRFRLDYVLVLFGYAPSADDYKIVALFWDYMNAERRMYLFSLRTDQWKPIDDVLPYATWFLHDRTFMINDAIYWPLMTSMPSQPFMGHLEMDDIFLKFDLVDEKLKEIPSMDWFVHYDWLEFFGMGGRLSLHCYGDQCSDVWVQKRYDDWNSWEKLFSVNLGGMCFLNFTETGKCLVQSPDQLKVIDPSRDSIEESQIGVHFRGWIIRTCAYVESSVSPFNPFFKYNNKNPSVIPQLVG